MFYHWSYRNFPFGPAVFTGTKEPDLRHSGSSAKRNFGAINVFFIVLAIVAISHAHVIIWPFFVGAAFLIGRTSGFGCRGRRSSPPPIGQNVWTPPAPIRPNAATPRPYDIRQYAPPPPAPASKPLSPSAQIAARLDGLVERISKLVSNDVLALVKSIVSTIEEILPMLDSERFAVGDADAFTIRQTALHYLPDTMAAYFRLPPKYRTSQALENGKTARQILIEQLTVLDAKMKEVAHNLASNDAQALLTNGHFLRERFATDLFTTV